MPLFNFNDLPLILIISQCGLLGLLLLVVKRGRSLDNALLAVFLLALALEALDALLYWCQPLKNQYFQDHHHLIFYLKFAGFIQGPALYFYICSRSSQPLQLQRKDALHLIPLVLLIPYLALTINSFKPDELARGIQDFNVYFGNPFFKALLLAQKVSVIAYASYAIYRLTHFRRQLKDNYSNLEQRDLLWLKVLSGGFLLVWLWGFSAQIVSYLALGEVADWLGVSNNYIEYVLISALVLFSLAKPEVVLSHEVEHSSGQPEQFDERDIERIEAAMLEGKKYLEPELTLDQLANELKIPSRQVSAIINRKFNQNFFEFVNRYRVEEAKRLLVSEGQKMNMLELMADAGFNSKSAFNRFFKKYTGLTPTQYRQKHSS